VLISTERKPIKVEATNSASLRMHRKAVNYYHQIYISYSEVEFNLIHKDKGET